MQTNKKKELVRVVRFTLFSASAGLIEFGSFAALSALTAWSYWPRYLIALVLSVVWNFTLNRKFTFKSANNVPKADGARAAVLCGVYAHVDAARQLADDTLGWNDYLVTVLNMLLNFATEYLYDRLVVFRGSIDTGAKRH